MIIKERSIPEKILILQALLRRLPRNYPKIPQLKGELAKSLAGYKGEQSVNYHLSFLPEKEFLLLYDLRLFNGNHYFQMDTLILTPYFAFY